MSDFKFQTTIDPKQLAKVFAVCGTEWGSPFTPEEFGRIEANSLVKHILSGRAGRGFYLEAKNGDIAATCIVTHHKGFYKEPSRGISNVPDPTTFGVNPITALRILMVFTAKEYRGRGLMARVVQKAIDYTEDEILKKELAKLNDKSDSLKLMVTTDGKVDKSLASYYLGKKYVWYLYSAIGDGYRRFGFKLYPLDGYKIPFALSGTDTYKLVEQVLALDSQHVEAGKKLRFLDGNNKLDLDLIDYILQGKELDLLTDLSKDNFHLELSGGHRSLSSLVNVSSALSSTRLGLSNELSAIAERMNQVEIGKGEGKDAESGAALKLPKSPTLANRKLSVHSFGVSRVGIKPEIQRLAQYHQQEEALADKNGSEENKKYSKIKGAILTNEFQQKSFYILWTTIMLKQFIILGMGELKLDLFGALADPSGFTNPIGRRRGSSFTGINDIGGFNFQDMAILVNTAVYVAKRRNNTNGSIYVTTNDLPTTVPTAVMHDFFLNYLSIGEQSNDASGRVEYVSDFGPEGRVLPAMKRFGNNSSEFELDWTYNSLATWG